MEDYQLDYERNEGNEKIIGEPIEKKENYNWIFYFFLFIIILALVGILIWLLVRNRSNNNNNVNADLNITGVNFNLVNNNTITATWTSVGNSSDVVTLYADTSQINLNASGKPEGSSTFLMSGPTAGNNRTITLTGLTGSTTYYLDLVVTNPNISGFNPTPDIVFTSGVAPTGSFVMQQISNPGGVTLNSNLTSVSYSLGSSKSSINDVWSYDSSSMNLSTVGTGINSGTTSCLYNNGGILAAQNCNSVKGNANAQWTYNVRGNNRWCLNGTQTCMSLALPITNNEQIMLVDNSTTKFINIPTQ